MTAIHEPHQSSLDQCVIDLINIERNLATAIRLQMADDRIRSFAEVREILVKLVIRSEERLERLESLGGQDGAPFATSWKPSCSTRTYPVSQMLRDDINAMEAAATSYAMLLAVGLATGQEDCVDVASMGLAASPQLAMRLAEILPAVICGELASAAPLADPSAAGTALAKIRVAWMPDVPLPELVAQREGRYFPRIALHPDHSGHHARVSA